jgi:3-phosphoshikimate 1-carboxyvinyltransferase
MDLKVFPPLDIVDVVINLPLSKSESARRLVLDAFGNVTDDSLVVADCDDTNALKHGLGVLTGDVNIGAAGTAMRFLTAYYAATPGTDIVLDGSERMRHRPIGILVDALRNFGADIDYVGEVGFPPLHIRGKQLTGGTLDVDAHVSSQFISALLMAAPSMQQPMQLNLGDTVTSLPYLKMTVAMMRRRGINVEFDGEVLKAYPCSYGTDTAAIEPDWSAASYWYEVTAFSGGWVTLPGLRRDSLQGDRAIADYSEQFGVITEFTDEGVQLSATPDFHAHLDLDMSETPDIVQTLAVLCATTHISFRFTGVHTLRNKETDRLKALYNEMLKLGHELQITGDDVLSSEDTYFEVPPVPHINTYNDHRMAMAFAPATIIKDGMVICDAEVVSKSYPGFWDDLRKAGFDVQPFTPENQ